ncbi:MAG: succinate dehydrogenase [Acidimicrobiia bacterium]|nr:succinate dehydrogenase [Acidimicrobiia bacterium]
MTSTQPRTRKVPWPVEFYRSAVGKKWIMAITGIALLGYLVAHIIGNLKIFMGPEGGVPAIDTYGVALRELLYPILPKTVTLWILRLGLLGAVLLHIHAAYSLTLMNRRARPVDYSGPRDYLAANYASRTMRWSGVIVIIFVLWHLADLTWGVQPMAPETWEHGEIFANFVATFQRPFVTLFYVVAQLCLGLHIYHGTWSMFQSLGINHPTFNQWRRWLAITLAVVLTLGNVAMPLAVFFGLVGA